MWKTVPQHSTSIGKTYPEAIGAGLWKSQFTLRIPHLVRSNIISRYKSGLSAMITKEIWLPPYTICPLIALIKTGVYANKLRLSRFLLLRNYPSLYLQRYSETELYNMVWIKISKWLNVPLRRARILNRKIIATLKIKVSRKIWHLLDW